MCALKKLTKIGEFLCSHFNIEDGRKYTTFSAYDAYYFKKGTKCNQNAKKDLCSVWRRCPDLLNVSKVVCEVSWYYLHFGHIILCCGAALCIGRCSAAPLASTHEKPIVGESRHTQNIQINKVTGKNEKCVFYVKKIKQTFGQPNVIENIKHMQKFNSTATLMHPSLNHSNHQLKGTLVHLYFLLHVYYSLIFYYKTLKDKDLKK